MPAVPKLISQLAWEWIETASWSCGERQNSNWESRAWLCVHCIHSIWISSTQCAEAVSDWCRGMQTGHAVGDPATHKTQMPEDLEGHWTNRNHLNSFRSRVQRLYWKGDRNAQLSGLQTPCHQGFLAAQLCDADIHSLTVPAVWQVACRRRESNIKCMPGIRYSAQRVWFNQGPSKHVNQRKTFQLLWFAASLLMPGVCLATWHKSNAVMSHSGS